jgi:mycothiol synthase
MDMLYSLRPTQPNDYAALVDLINAHSLLVTGTQWAHVEHFQLDAPAVTMIDPAGLIVGYAQIASEEPDVVQEWSGCVHPDHLGQGIGSQLLRWAEDTARQRITAIPEGVRAVLHTEIFNRDAAAQTLLEDNGFSLVRRWMHLKIHLTAPPPPPDWPTGISIHTVRKEDWSALGAALDLAFADHWGVIPPSTSESPTLALPLSEPGSQQFGRSLFNTPGLCFMAVAGDEIVASCLCNQTTIEWPGGGRLGSLSVRPEWRRRGLGRALIAHAFRAFWDRGIRQITTDTDADSFFNTPALYQGAGMEVFRYQHLYEKEIKPGMELRRTTPPA